MTLARVDGLISDLRERGVPLLPLNVLACLTDAGLCSDSAALIAEAVGYRLAQLEGVA